MGRFTPRLMALLRATFAADSLPPPPPPAPPPGSPKRGVVALLFAPEPLPPELPPAPRRESRWLAWFFAPDDLEP